MDIPDSSFVEKIRGFISALKTTNKFSIIAIVLLLAAVPITVLTLQQQQEVRQRASANQASITVNPTTPQPGDTVTLTWTLEQAAQPTNTPIPTPAECTPRPNIIRAPLVNPPGKMLVTLTAGNNAGRTGNLIKKITLTSLSNVSVTIGTYTYSVPTTIDIAAVPTTSIIINQIIPGQAGTLIYQITDNCGAFTDTQGGGPTVWNTAATIPTSTPIPTNTPTPTPTPTRVPTPIPPTPTPTRVPTPIPPTPDDYYYNDPNNNGSFIYIPHAYAQTTITITGAETFQLFHINGTIQTAIGAKIYLATCQPQTAGGTPPTTPKYSGNCTYQIPSTIQPGSYLFRTFATDGTTNLGDSNLITISALTIPTDSALGEGLVSYWTMDETTGTTAANAQNATLNATIGTTNSFGPGKIKNALFNPGTGAGATVPYTTASPIDFSGNSKQSLSFWLKTTAMPRHVRLLQPLGAPCGAWGLAYLADGSILLNTFCDNSKDLRWTGVVTADNVWHHFVFSYDGVNASIYKDGVLVATKPYSPQWISGGRTLFIGGDTEYPLYGGLDEVGIWNRSLSASDVQKLAQGTRPTFSPTTGVTPTTIITPPPPVTICTTDAACAVNPINKKCNNYQNYQGTCIDPNNPPVCAQVRTRACHLIGTTKECIAFPTPCVVPPGWTIEPLTCASPPTCPAGSILTTGLAPDENTCPTYACVTQTTGTPFKFDFSVFLTGIGSPSGTANPLRPNRPFYVSLINSNNVTVAQKEAMLTYDKTTGSFKGTIDINAPCPTQTIIPSTDFFSCFPKTTMAIPYGNYTMKIMTPKFLRKQIPGIISIQPNTDTIIPPLKLISGDMYPDNLMNIKDFNIVNSCLESKALANNCAANRFPDINLSQKEAADLNDDGIVDGIDYNLFIRALSTKEGN